MASFHVSTWQRVLLAAARFVHLRNGGPNGDQRGTAINLALGTNSKHMPIKDISLRTFVAEKTTDMAQSMTRKALSGWNSGEIVGFSSDPDDDSVGFDDIVFGFLEQREGSQELPCDSREGEGEDEDEDEHEHEKNSSNVEENKKFWESQNQILQATLYRTTSLESKIRQATKEAVRETNELGLPCMCRKQMTGGCRDCLRREVSARLQKEGYNCAICKSKWKSSQDIISGEHTYLEVVERQGSKKGEMIRVVIELNFLAEFEIARASEEYNQLISRLPEVFVGKAERLKSLIKILCTAAKKCMKDKNMHLGPWRKHKYMQSKWLATYERSTTAATAGPLPVGFSDRAPSAKPKASLLTYDLLETLPFCQRTAVRVV